VNGATDARTGAGRPGEESVEGSGEEVVRRHSGLAARTVVVSALTLLSRILPEQFVGSPERGNDCWGYVSPSGREARREGCDCEVGR
jgi:hypothetical protein